MNRLRALLLSLALVAACGPSGAPPQTRVGVAAAPPPSGRTITYDPSVVGLPAAVNTTVYDSQGVISWVKYGTSNTAWRPVPVTQIVTGDPSQAPGLKAPPGFVVTKNDGTASWIKKTTSDTGWVVNPVSGADGGAPLSAPVANASLATMAGGTVKGNAGTDAGAPSDLTAALLSTLLSNNLQSAYSSPLVSLTAVGSFVMNVPQRPGFLFMPMLARLLFHDYTGTATGSLVISGGNDASKLNIFGSTILASTLNTDGAASPFMLTLGVSGAVTPLLDSGTLIVGTITTPPTGVTSAHGYVVVSGFWLPI